MKYISNLHTHSIYCDGQNSIEENILYAIEKEFISLGFSGHSYLYFDEGCMSQENTIKYLEDIKKYKKIYKDKIQIYAGIEGDFYSNLNKETDKDMHLDYRIGSVHCICDDSDVNNKKYFSIDMSKLKFDEALNHFNGIKTLIELYFDNVISMVKNQKPDIVGHLDLPRKYNFNKDYFTEEEDWYLDKVNEVLDVIKDSDCIIEVNTRKMSKDNMNACYPNINTIKEILKRDISLTINTDAHSIKGLDYFYSEAVEQLKNLGVKSIKMLIDNSFKDIDINDVLKKVN